jgi:hypothetical protein
MAKYLKKQLIELLLMTLQHLHGSVDLFALFNDRVDLLLSPYDSCSSFVDLVLLFEHIASP